MGVKSLIKLIKHYSPDAIVSKKIIDYKGKILGIDGNLMIYKNTLAIRNTSNGDLFNDDIMVTHIHSMLNKLISFRKFKITPIFVFDGGYPNIKEQTMVTRSLKKDYNLDKEIEECIALIRCFGFRVIMAKLEADTVLAKLSVKKIINYIVSDDMDILIFGGTKMLKNFSVDPKKDIHEINLNTILKRIKIDRRDLIDISIILGTDYIIDLKPVANGIGPIKVVPFIKDSKSIKNDVIIDVKTYNKVVKYYLNQKPEYTILEGTMFNRNKIIKFLREFKFGDKYLEKINKIP